MLKALCDRLARVVKTLSWMVQLDGHDVVDVSREPKDWWIFETEVGEQVDTFQTLLAPKVRGTQIGCEHERLVVFLIHRYGCDKVQRKSKDIWVLNQK